MLAARPSAAEPASAPRAPAPCAAAHVLAAAADPLAGAGHAQDAHRPPAASVSSCITMASAPCGTGAPVKMRAAVPGSSGSRIAGRNALADGQRPRPRRDLGAAHGIAVHGAVVLRRHFSGGHQVLGASTRPSASKVETRSVGAGGARQQVGQARIQRLAAARRARSAEPPGDTRTGPDCRPATGPRIGSFRSSTGRRVAPAARSGESVAMATMKSSSRIAHRLARCTPRP